MNEVTRIIHPTVRDRMKEVKSEREKPGVVAVEAMRNDIICSFVVSKRELSSSSMRADQRERGREQTRERERERTGGRQIC